MPSSDAFHGQKWTLWKMQTFPTSKTVFTESSMYVRQYLFEQAWLQVEIIDGFITDQLMYDRIYGKQMSEVMTTFKLSPVTDLPF